MQRSMAHPIGVPVSAAKANQSPGLGAARKVGKIHRDDGWGGVTMTPAVRQVVSATTDSSIINAPKGIGMLVQKEQASMPMGSHAVSAAPKCYRHVHDLHFLVKYAAVSTHTHTHSFPSFLPSLPPSLRLPVFPFHSIASVVRSIIYLFFHNTFVFAGHIIVVSVSFFVDLLPCSQSRNKNEQTKSSFKAFDERP